MNDQFEHRIKTVDEKFAALMAMPPLARDQIPSDATKAGVYLFSSDSKHYYVGRSKNVRERILQHSRLSVLDAPFAFRRTREKLKLWPTYTEKNSRPQLLARKDFRNELQKQKSWIATLDIRFVFEKDPVTQVLLEIYTSDALRARYNDFNTT